MSRDTPVAGHAPVMHVVGARFRTLAAAAAALRAIRSAVRVAPGDAGVRPLGSTRYEAPTEDFLLAGRFDGGDVDAVVEIVRAHDGQVLERRSEAASAAVTATIVSNPPVPLRTAGLPAWPPPRPAGSHATRTGRRGRAERHRKRLRRPSARLRGRAARAHRLR